MIDPEDNIKSALRNVLTWRNLSDGVAVIML